MNSNTFEAVVGAAVLLIAAAFFGFAYSNGQSRGPSGGYHVLAQFDNVEGINVGTDVRIAGIKIGTVVGQTLDPATFQAKIDMLLDPKIKLADDSSAKVTSEGLLGAKFITLAQGGSEAKLKDGSEINYTQGSVDMWNLISQAMFSKKGGDTPKPEDTTPKQ